MLKILDSNKLFFYVISVGIIVRLLWVFLFNTYPETDFMWYHVKAVELSEGKGFLNGIYPYYIGTEGVETAFRPIGYPGTLSILYLVFGTNFLVAKLFNVFLAGLIMYLIYKIANKYFTTPVANLSVFLYAFSPLAICYTSITGSETLFSGVLILSVYTFFILKKPYITGFLIGYLTLVRPIAVLLPLVFLLFILIKKNFSKKEKIKEFIIISFMVAIVIAPWIIRNQIVFGVPVFSTNGGYVVYVNNNPNATGSWSDPFKYPDSPMLKYRYEQGFDELGIHNEGKELAVKWIIENPDRFVKLGFLRIANSYWLKNDDIMWAFTTGIDTWHPFVNKAVKIEKILYRPFYILLFAYLTLMSFNIIKTRKIDFNTFILLLFMYFTSMMFVLEGNPRYVFPMHTFYSMSVSYIIIMLYNKLSRKNVLLER